LIQKWSTWNSPGVASTSKTEQLCATADAAFKWDSVSPFLPNEWMELKTNRNQQDNKPWVTLSRWWNRLKPI